MERLLLEQTHVEQEICRLAALIEAEEKREKILPEQP